MMSTNSADEVGLFPPSYFALLCSRRPQNAMSTEILNGILQHPDTTARLSLLKAQLCGGWVYSGYSRCCSSDDLDEAFVSLSGCGSMESSVQKRPRSQCISFIDNVFCAFVDRLANEKQICGKVWGPQEPGYRCHSCEMSQFACLCTSCFNQGNHFQHDYTVFHSPVGGVCDCGDDIAFKSGTFCAKHVVVRNQESSKLSEHEMNASLLTAKPLLAILMERIVWNLRIMHYFDLSDHEASIVTLNQEYVVFKVAKELGPNCIPSWYNSDFLEKLHHGYCLNAANLSTSTVLQHIIDKYISQFQSNESEIVLLCCLEMNDLLLNFISTIAKDSSILAKVILDTMNSKSVSSLVPHLLVDRIARTTGQVTRSISKSHLCGTVLTEFVFWCCITRYRNNLKMVLITLALHQCNKKSLIKEYLATYSLASRILHTSHDIAMMNRMIHFSVAIYCDFSHFHDTMIYSQMIGTLLNSLWISPIECENGLVACPVRYDSRSNKDKVIDSTTHMVLNHLHPMIELYLSWQASTEIMIAVCHKTAVEVFISQPRLFGMWLDVVTRLQGITYLRESDLSESSDSSHTVIDGLSTTESKVSMTELHVCGSILGSVARTIKRSISNEEAAIANNGFSIRNDDTLSKSVDMLLTSNPINPAVLLSNILQVLNNLGSWFNNVGLTCNLISSHESARIANVNLDLSVTFQLPLHRILSNFLFILIDRFRFSANQIFKVVQTQMHAATRLLELIIVHPVQLQYAISRSESNPTVSQKHRRSSLLYMCTKSFAGSPSIDRDRFLIQALCSTLPTDIVMYTLLRRFRVFGDYFEKPGDLIEYFNELNNDDSRFSSRIHCELLESLMCFIAQLLAVSISLDPMDPETLTKEAIAILCIENKSFSEIENSLPAYTRNSRCRTILCSVIKSIAEFIPPEIVDGKPRPGYFRLNDNSRYFDPLFVMYRSILRPEWYLKAMAHYVKWIRKVRPDIPESVLRKLWPPLCTQNVNTDCNRLVESRFLHQFIYLLLRSYLKCDKIGERTLNFCVYLLRIGLESKITRDNEEPSLKCIYKTNDLSTNVFMPVKDLMFTESSHERCSEPTCIRCKANKSTKIEVFDANNDLKETSIASFLIEILNKDSQHGTTKAVLRLSDRQRVLKLIESEHLIEIENGICVGTEIAHIATLLRLIRKLGESQFQYWLSQLSDKPVPKTSIVAENAIKDKIREEFIKKQLQFAQTVVGPIVNNVNGEFDRYCVICREDCSDLPLGLVSYNQRTDVASRQFVSLTPRDNQEYDCVDTAYAKLLQDFTKNAVLLRVLSEDLKLKLAKFATLRLKTLSSNEEYSKKSESSIDVGIHETAFNSTEITVTDGSLVTTQTLKVENDSSAIDTTENLSNDHAEHDDNPVKGQKVAHLSNANFNDYNYFQSCGHFAHLKCISGHSDGLTDFECPVCRRRCNSIIPMIGKSLEHKSKEIALDFVDRAMPNIHWNDMSFVEFLRAQLESDLLGDFRRRSYKSTRIIGECVNIFRSLLNRQSVHFNYLLSSLELRSSLESSYIPILFYDPLIVMINLILFGTKSPSETLDENVQSVFELSLSQAMIAISLAGNRNEVDTCDEVSRCLERITTELKSCGFPIKESLRKPINLKHIMMVLQHKIVRGLAFLRLSIMDPTNPPSSIVYLINKSNTIDQTDQPIESFAELCEWIGVNETEAWDGDKLSVKCRFWIDQVFEGRHDASMYYTLIGAVCNFEGFACRTLLQPNLMPLPARLNTLHKQVALFTCPDCRSMPFTNHLKYRPDDIKVCLLCSIAYASSGSDCAEITCCEKIRRKWAMHSRTGLCNNKHLGLEMNLRNSIVRIYGNDGSSYEWGGLYLDENGEEDVELGRGRPLILNEKRFMYLQEHWINVTLNATSSTTTDDG